MGDGDLSFSAALSRKLGRPCDLTVTTYDSASEFDAKYRQSLTRKQGLSAQDGIRVIHGVDATRLDDDDVGRRLDNDDDGDGGGGRPKQKRLLFDLVIFNFPHCGWVDGNEREDSAAMVLRQRHLIFGFLRKALCLTNRVQMRLKSGHPYCCWGFQQLAREAGWSILSSVPFDAAREYPGYHCVYGAGRRSHRRFSPEHAMTVELERPAPSATVAREQPRRVWRCDACGVSAASEELLLPHLMGSRHRKTIACTPHRV